MKFYQQSSEFLIFQQYNLLPLAFLKNKIKNNVHGKMMVMSLDCQFIQPGIEEGQIDAAESGQ